MASFNQFIGLGYLTREPELRYTPSGVAVASFSIGINESWKDAKGEKKERTLFMPCDAWKGSAEFLGEYAKKGNLVHVTGTLVMEEWEDKQTGQAMKKIKCQVKSIQICERKAADGQGEGAPVPKPNPYRKPVDSVPEAPADDALPNDNDVPF